MSDKTLDIQFDKLFKKIIEDIRYPISYGLQIYDKPLNEEGKVSYPFYSYSIISQRLVQNIPYNFYNYKEEKIEYTFYEQWEMNLSFTAISMSIYESIEAAKKLQDWFRTLGNDFLLYNQIVKVRMGPITQRDFMMVTDYERRNGFDITLRISRQVGKQTTTIETVILPDNILRGK